MNRPVHILTLAFRGESPEAVFEAVEENLRSSTDILLLPEMWLGDDLPVQGPESALLKRVADVAQRHSCYVICPLAYCAADEKDMRYNTALVFDREGSCIYRYNKVFPWWDEFKFDPPCTPGGKAGCFQTDFGTCGIAICFDVNFPQLWADMADQGAEIVFWPSDYSAGRSLQAHAINHHYYIVSATRERDSALIDLTGDEIAYHKSEGITVCRYTVDLDRSIFHENYNMEKMQKLVDADCGISLERCFPREQWFILSGSEMVSVKEAAKEEGMEQLREYLHRSALEINPQYLDPNRRNNR